MGLEGLEEEKIDDFMDWDVVQPSIEGLHSRLLKTLQHLIEKCFQISLEGDSRHKGKRYP